MTLGEIIKQLRNQKQLSQPQLAESAGIEQSYLSKLENNHSVPSNDILRKLLAALDIELEQLLEKLPHSELHQLAKQIPDIEHYLNSKKQQNYQQSRKLLLLSSLLIVLATTLFYIGYSRLAFSEWQYRYESEGIVKPGEPINIFNSWHRDLSDGKQIQQKREEMRLRYKPDYLTTDYNHGNKFVQQSEQGRRLYRQKQRFHQPQTINAILRVLGVLLFSAGVMGFILELRLSQKANRLHL